MPQIVEFLRIFSKPVFLLILPFALVILATVGKPASRRVGLISAGAFVFISCYPILAVSIATVSAMSDQQPETVYKVEGRVGSYRSDGDGEYPLRLSHYDPSLCYDAKGNIIANTNCDSDPTTMASGDKVASWVNGRNGVYAAACPREWGWGHGTRFTVAGLEFECRDTGGWINCYNPGEYDPALKSNATLTYCWVDLLTAPVADYGALTKDWRLE